MDDERATLDEQFEQWLTGFWEGDGSCGTQQDGYSVIPYITLAQKDKGVIEHVMDLLGFGYIGYSSGGYRLRIGGSPRCAKVFALLCKHVVGQQSVDKINRVFEELGLDVRAQKCAVAIPWLVGFFDAEGNVDWSNMGDLQAKISQKEWSILESTRVVIGGSIIRGSNCYNLTLCGNGFRTFIPQILRYTHHTPKKQVLLAKVHALAREGKGVWGDWARVLLEVECNA